MADSSTSIGPLPALDETPSDVTALVTRLQLFEKRISELEEFKANATNSLHFVDGENRRVRISFEESFGRIAEQLGDFYRSQTSVVDSIDRLNVDEANVKATILGLSQALADSREETVKALTEARIAREENARLREEVAELRTSLEELRSSSAAGSAKAIDTAVAAKFVKFQDETNTKLDAIRLNVQEMRGAAKQAALLADKSRGECEAMRLELQKQLKK